MLAWLTAMSEAAPESEAPVVAEEVTLTAEEEAARTARRAKRIEEDAKRKARVEEQKARPHVLQKKWAQSAGGPAAATVLPRPLQPHAARARPPPAAPR